MTNDTSYNIHPHIMTTHITFSQGTHRDVPVNTETDTTVDTPADALNSNEYADAYVGTGSRTPIAPGVPTGPAAMKGLFAAALLAQGTITTEVEPSERGKLLKGVKEAIKELAPDGNTAQEILDRYTKLVSILDQDLLIPRQFDQFVEALKLFEGLVTDIDGLIRGHLKGKKAAYGTITNATERCLKQLNSSLNRMSRRLKEWFSHANSLPRNNFTDFFKRLHNLSTKIAELCGACGSVEDLVDAIEINAELETNGHIQFEKGGPVYTSLYTRWRIRRALVEGKAFLTTLDKVLTQPEQKGHQQLVRKKIALIGKAITGTDVIINRAIHKVWNSTKAEPENLSDLKLFLKTALMDLDKTFASPAREKRKGREGLMFLDSIQTKLIKTMHLILANRQESLDLPGFITYLEELMEIIDNFAARYSSKKRALKIAALDTILDGIGVTSAADTKKNDFYAEVEWLVAEWYKRVAEKMDGTDKMAGTDKVVTLDKALYLMEDVADFFDNEKIWDREVRRRKEIKELVETLAGLTDRQSQLEEATKKLEAATRRMNIANNLAAIRKTEVALRAKGRSTHTELNGYLTGARAVAKATLELLEGDPERAAYKEMATDALRIKIDALTRKIALQNDDIGNAVKGGTHRLKNPEATIAAYAKSRDGFIEEAAAAQRQYADLTEETSSIVKNLRNSVKQANILMEGASTKKAADEIFEGVSTEIMAFQDPDAAKTVETRLALLSYVLSNATLDEAMRGIFTELFIGQLKEITRIYAGAKEYEKLTNVLFKSLRTIFRRNGGTQESIRQEMDAIYDIVTSFIKESDLETARYILDAIDKEVKLLEGLASKDINGRIDPSPNLNRLILFYEFYKKLSEGFQDLTPATEGLANTAKSLRGVLGKKLEPALKRTRGNKPSQAAKKLADAVTFLAVKESSLRETLGQETEKKMCLIEALRAQRAVKGEFLGQLEKIVFTTVTLEAESVFKSIAETAPWEAKEVRFISKLVKETSAMMDRISILRRMISGLTEIPEYYGELSPLHDIASTYLVIYWHFLRQNQERFPKDQQGEIEKILKRYSSLNTFITQLFDRTWEIKKGQERVHLSLAMRQALTLEIAERWDALSEDDKARLEEETRKRRDVVIWRGMPISWFGALAEDIVTRGITPLDPFSHLKLLEPMTDVNALDGMFGRLLPALEVGAPAVK